MSEQERALNQRTIAASTIWSLLGQVLPAAVGLVATPTIVRGLGDERFGLLALAWLVIGYFSLFDLGLGRAVTKIVAERVGANDDGDLRHIVGTAWAVMLILGVIAALLPLPAVPWIIAHGMRASAAFRGEATSSLYLLLLSMPAIILMNGFRGVLEAYHRFGLVNVVRIPFGIATFVVPLIVLRVTPALPTVIAGLVVARYIATAAYAIMCIVVLGRKARPRMPQRAVLRELLGFGAWITVSNIVGPIMVTFDRFVIGALVSVAMVTYYATPFQAVMQFLLLPSAIATVLFPVFSQAATMEPARVRALYGLGVQVIYLALYPCALLILAFAPDLLRLWLGGSFPAVSSVPMRWLMLGVVMNGVAQVPFALIQGLGRSDLTAKVHLAELPLYLALLFWVATVSGIDGVSFAWFLRSAVDMAVMTWFALRLLCVDSPRETVRFIVVPLAALIPLAPVVFIAGLQARLLATAVGGVIFLWVVWTRVLHSQLPPFLSARSASLRAAASAE